MASIKETVITVLKEGKDPLKEITGKDFKLLRTLISIGFDANRSLQKKAAKYIGRLTGKYSWKNPQKVKDLISRFVWILNDESGHNPEAAPEILGEIGYNCPEYIESFLDVLMNYHRDEKLRPKVLWAAGHMGAKNPQVLTPAAYLIARYIDDPDPEVAEIARWALKNIGTKEALAMLK